MTSASGGSQNNKSQKEKLNLSGRPVASPKEAFDSNRRAREPSTVSKKSLEPEILELSLPAAVLPKPDFPVGLVPFRLGALQFPVSPSQTKH